MKKRLDRERQVGMMLDLNVGPTVFQMRLSVPDKALILNWVGMTNLRNVIWLRFVVVGPHWPPVRSVSCFCVSDEVGCVRG